MLPNSIVVIIQNSLLLPLTEEVCKRTGQRTISAYVMYYSKKCTRLSGRGRLRERSLTKAFNYIFSNARFVTDSIFLSGLNYSESGLSLVEKRSVSQLKIKILPDSQLSISPIHTLFNVNSTGFHDAGRN